MYHIRRLALKDNASIAQIIRQVSAEHGLAADAGFAVADPIVDAMFDYYQHQNAAYWVIVDEQDRVYGGGGIAALNADQDCLELQKMYFLKQIRGLGWAQAIVQLAVEHTQQRGFQYIYLETTAHLSKAIQLYERLGFTTLAAPRGNTGHSQACEIWMLKSV